MKISTKFIAMALFMAIAISFPAFSQTSFTWGGSDTTWSTASAWSPNGVPGASDTVTISTGVIRTDGDVSVGGFFMSGGILSGTNTLTVSGAAEMSGGKMEGSGTMAVSAGGTLAFSDINLKTIDGWAVSNSGNATWSGTGNIRIMGGASLVNESGATLTIQNDALFDVSTGSGSISNKGTFTKTSAGSTVVELPFTNEGTVNANSGVLQFTGGSANTSATYNTGAGATVEFRDLPHTLSDVSFSGSGNINMTTGADGTVSGTSGLTVDAGVNFTLTGNDSRLTGTGPITIDGAMNWEREEVSGSGDFTINGTLEISGSSSRTLSGRTLTNNGAVTWSGSGSMRITNNATINNQAGSTFETQVDGLMDFLDPSGGVFNNAGTFTKSGGAGNSTLDIAFNNTGTVNINSGNIRLTRGGNSTNASYAIQSGSMVEFDGDTHTMDNIDFNTDGAVQISSNTVSINGNGATIGANTAFSLNAGTLNGVGPIKIDGTFNWNGGFLSGSDTITVNNVMNINGSNDKTMDTRVLVNNGTINWTGTGAFELDNSAELINEAGGVIDWQNNVELDFVFPTGGIFTNLGTVNKTAGLGEAKIDVPTVNNGTMNINSGTVSFLRGSIITNGTVNVAAGAIAELSGNIHTMNDANFSGTGAVEARDDATLTAIGNGLTVGTGLTLSTFGSGTTINGGGPVTIEGTYNWNRGVLTGSGSLIVNGTLLLSGTSSRDLDGKNITVNGAMQSSAINTLRVKNSSQITVAAGGSIDFQTDNNIDFLSPNGGSIVNNGTILKSGGAGSSFIDIPVTNNTTISALSGAIRLLRGGDYVNSGLTAGPGATLEFDGGTHNLDNTQFSGSGTILLSSNTLNINGSGTNFVDGLTLQMDGGIVTGSGDVTVNGTLVWDRGTISGNGAFMAVNILTIQGNSARLLDGRTLTNTGVGTWSGDGEIRLTNNATLLNDVGGLIEQQSDADIKFTAPNGGTVINNGTFSKTAGGLLGADIEVNFVNNGVLNVETGTIAFHSNLNNAANGTIQGGGTLDVTDANFTNEGTVNPGTSPGQLTLTGKFAPAASSVFNIELGGLAAGTEHDQLVVTDTLFMDGTVNISLINGHTPAIGSEYTIFAYGAKVGEFPTINDPNVGIRFIPFYNANDLVLRVLEANLPPEAVADTVSTPEDNALAIDVLANDFDGNSGDVLTIVDFNQTVNGVLTALGDSAFSYQPNSNFFGVDSFTYKISDGNGFFDSTNVHITITAVNDNPFIAPGIPNIIFQEDSSATLDLDAYASDADHDTTQLVWNAQVISAANVEVDTSDLDVTIDPITHVATFSATPDSSGIFTVVFSVTDPGGLSDTDTMEVTVNDQPSPFVLNPVADIDYPEDSGPRTVVSDLDSVFFNPFPDIPLSYSASSDNGDIQVSVVNDSLRANFSANYVGSGNITISAVGDDNVTITDVFAINVTEVNDLPVLSGLPESIVFPGDSTPVISMWDFVSDIETPDSLLIFQFTASNDSLARNYNLDTGTLTLFAQSGFHGDVDLVVIVNDGNGGTANDTIAVTVTEVVGIDDPFENGLPTVYELDQNYPNPFNPNTTIRFQLPETQTVTLSVYSVLGQKVRTLVNGKMQAGYHEAMWDGLSDHGAQLSSGVYIYRLEAGSFQQVRKMILLK